MKTITKNSLYDIIRLGKEMQYRGFQVWEHSQFGGVNPRYHMPNSKHGRDLAIDLNYNPRVPKNAEEDRRFDRLAPELVRRKFGCIWNRGRGDHDSHLHAETWGSPVQYGGRYRLKRRRYWRKLKADGTWGPQTTRALQEWLGTPVDGKFDWGGRSAKALQAFLNTELRGSLKIDGKFGRNSIKALQRYLGTPQTGAYSDRGSTMVKAMQLRLSAYGHL